MPDKVKITIDGKELEVDPGRSILRTALQNGIHIPHLCYHPGLSVAGNCRICLVEIEGAPKLAISCNEMVRDGMTIHTSSEQVLKARASTLEFLLVNHPLDCSVCDKSGECLLQNYTYDHRKYPDESYIDSRMELDKILPNTKELGPNLWLWANRCIHCSRCVRFTDEISGNGELTFVLRGAKAEIDCHSGNPVDNNLSGNVVDLCPVGALLDKDFLYKSRVWFLEKRDSVCPHCSKGCNISVQGFRNKLQRFKPRPNPDVNSYWICDQGRQNRDYFDLERITSPLIRNGKSLRADSRKAALNQSAETLKQLPAGSIAALGSCQSTCEDNFALRLLVEQLGGKVFAIRKATAGKREEFREFVIEAEKAPNSKGALAVLDKAEAGTDDLCKKIESGDVKAVVALGNELEAPLTDKEISALGKLDFLMVIDSWHSPLVELADVVLPAAIYAEKEGTFVNSAGRAQHITQCFLPEGGQAVSEWIWLKRLSDKLEGGWEFNTSSGVFSHLAKNNRAFSGLSYSKLGKRGELIIENSGR